MIFCVFCAPRSLKKNRIKRLHCECISNHDGTIGYLLVHSFRIIQPCIRAVQGKPEFWLLNRDLTPEFLSIPLPIPARA